MSGGILYILYNNDAGELDKVDDEACVTCERWHNMIGIAQIGHGS